MKPILRDLRWQWLAVGALTCAPGGLPSYVYAGSDPLTETISVTGSRLAVTERPAGSELIDTELIEAWNQWNLADLLRHVSGTDTSMPGGAGAVDLFIRGADANFTTVLIDGVRVNNPSNSRGGSYDFATLDVAGIDRIEIVRGPVSVVYGPDALSGVVNIITRGASEQASIAVGGEMGTQHFSRAYARAASPLSDRLSGALFVAQSDALEAIDGYSTQLDTIQSTLNYADAARSANLRFRYGESKQTAYPDASGGPKFAVSRVLEQFEGREWAASFETRQQMTRNWAGQLSGSVFERREDVFTPAIFGDSRTVTPSAEGASRYRSQQVVLNNQIALGTQARLAVGAELRRETGQHVGDIWFGSIAATSEFDLERTIYGAFLEAQYTARSGLEFFAGSRLDDPQGFDMRVSSRVGASYVEPKTGIRVHTGWTNGFKLPSFYALGDSLVGNTTLKEETAQALELGISIPLPQTRANIDVTGYVSKYRDLIDFDFATLQLVNRSQVHIKGAEAKISLMPHQTLGFDAHVAYTGIEVAGTEDSLPLRPTWRGGLTAIWRPNEYWTLHSSAIGVGSCRASSIPTGDITLPSYLRVDASVSRKVRERYQLKAAVDNLLNARYQQDAGVPSPGIIVRIGAEVRL